MGKEKKSGFFAKFLGGNKTSSCCAVEFEEIPETGSNPKEETSVTEPEKKETPNTGCGCGC